MRKKYITKLLDTGPDSLKNASIEVVPTVAEQLNLSEIKSLTKL